MCKLTTKQITKQSTKRKQIRSERYIYAAYVLEKNYKQTKISSIGVALKKTFKDIKDSMACSTHHDRIIEVIRVFSPLDNNIRQGIQNINSFSPEEKVLALLFMAEFVKD